MPRRKRAFIQRSNAHTYHVIRQPTSENPDNHILVADPIATASSSIEPQTNDSDVSKTYSSRDYELGEFGFPEDGYDYAKHFRSIGGGGGVYMSSATGLPDPDAVRQLLHPNTKQKKKPPTSSNDVVILKELDSNENEEGIEQGEDGNGGPTLPLDEQASMLRKQALDDLQRDRKRNTDLNQILHELDGDDLITERETDAEEEEEGDDADDYLPEANEPSDDVKPDDYFDKLILGDEQEYEQEYGERDGEAIDNGGRKSLEGVREKHREPRLLDAQFDDFMQEFENDASSSEAEKDIQELQQCAETAGDTCAEDIFALLKENEKQSFIGFEEETSENGGTEMGALLDGLSELKLLDADATTSKQKMESGGEADETKNAAITEGHREAEFERGMDGVLDSFVRIPATEVLGGSEGVDGALQALDRIHAEETARLERLHDEGRVNEEGESDGQDSELETLFDEEYNKQEAQWDCETIISTYSNFDNHPSVIDAPCRRERRDPRNASSRQSVIRLDPRTQAPAEFISPLLAPVGESVRTEVDFGTRLPQQIEGRKKEESKEEKKKRKTTVKELARQRRSMKSEMKKAFGAESVKQNKHSAAYSNAKVAVQF